MAKPLHMERILVTGGSGLVGCHVVKDLGRRGLKVGVLDVKEPPEPVEDYIQADVTRPELLSRALEGWDAVVHMAALLPQSEATPEDLYRVNAYGTFCVAEACARGGLKRLIYVSSDAVLGFALGQGLPEPRYLPIDEDHPTRPVDPYGLGKLAGEEACRAAAYRSNLRVLVLRPPWIWVPEEYDLYRSYTTEPGRPDWIRDLWAYIHVDDLAEAIYLGLKAHEPPPFEVLFVAAADNGTDRASRSLVKDFLPCRPHIAGTFGRRESFISFERAKGRLGYLPRRSWPDFLAGTD